MLAPDATLRDLRAMLAQIERGTPGECAAAPSPLPQLTRSSPGWPSRGALHEIQAADPGAELAFCALILGRTAGPPRMTRRYLALSLPSLPMDKLRRC
jgi:hypothetical protein